MGSAGHAFIAHTKSLSPPAQTKDGGYGLPPHPLTVRPGQRYSTRGARRRRVFEVRRITGNRVWASYVEDRKQRVTVSAARLLATRDDGQGRYFQFQGFAARRYATSAVVCALAGDTAVLCVPEWHPRRPVRLPCRLVPEPGRVVGAWLALHCDLSASSAARLQPADLLASQDPGHDTVHRPDLAADM